MHFVTLCIKGLTAKIFNQQISNLKFDLNLLNLISNGTYISCLSFGYAFSLRARSLVVSDLRSEANGSRFESSC